MKEKELVTHRIAEGCAFNWDKNDLFFREKGRGGKDKHIINPEDVAALKTMMKCVVIGEKAVACPAGDFVYHLIPHAEDLPQEIITAVRELNHPSIKAFQGAHYRLVVVFGKDRPELARHIYLAGKTTSPVISEALKKKKVTLQPNS